MDYYPLIVLVTVMSMVMELVHLSENESLKRRENINLRIISCLVIVGAVCEYLGVYLDNKSENTRIFHLAVKTIEFSVSPVIPYFFCKVISVEHITKRMKTVVVSLLSLNVVIELVNIFIPVTFYIDSNNVYHRGEFFFIYYAFYIVGAITFVIVLMRTIKKYQNKNIFSLVSMMIFLSVGFTVRFFCPGIRFEWLIVAIIVIAFISYYSDLILQVDSLTQLLNRMAYENDLKKIDYATCIIRLDVNQFKKINDTYGHQCGDVCLRAVANTIYKAYGSVAYCYRTGGDEFDVIFKPTQLEKISADNGNYDVYKAIEDLNDKFDKLLSKKATKYKMLDAGCSKGYGLFYGFFEPNAEEIQGKQYTAGTISEVISIADKRMYENKQEMNTGANNGIPKPKHDT